MKDFLSLCVLTVAVASCSVDGVEKNSTLGESCSPEFYSNLPTVDEGVRTYVDSELNLRWTADDRISIFTSTYNQQYRFKGKTGDNSGSFEVVSGDGFVSGNSMDRNYAVYPYREETGLLENGQLKVVLPSVIAYAENSFGVGANTMVAVTHNREDTFLAFKNICGVLELKLWGEGAVKSVTIKGNNGEKIAGESTVTYLFGQTPEVSIGAEGTEEITMDCGDGIILGNSAQSVTSFWFVIPPVTFSQGFTVIATNTEGLSMVKKVSSSRTVRRNIKNSMPALNVMFDTRLGNIQFEDADFKAYCVEHFDTDGDGEISYAEGKAITSIDVNTDNIASVKEIKWFPKLANLSCRGSFHGTPEGVCFDGQLSELDVSANTELTSLSCGHNQISSLDVTALTKLASLNFEGNKLASIDLSCNPDLSLLICQENQLSELDITHCNLSFLCCKYNKLKTLNTSNHSKLATLQCENNMIGLLDVSNNVALVSLSCGSNPQLKEIWLARGQTIQDFFHDSSVSSVKYKGVIEAVDLGLSVKWASFNLGADVPWNFGRYFAWGDVEGQTWNGSMWSGGGFSTTPAYQLDTNGNLKSEYDAANVDFGDNWRMPTKAEQLELIDNCISSWTDNYCGTGIAGRIFTSKKTGYTGNSIFMPAAGFGSNSLLSYKGSDGRYWSSTFNDVGMAWNVTFNSDYVSYGGDYCASGRSVRPVFDPGKNASGSIPSIIDDGRDDF